MMVIVSKRGNVLRQCLSILIIALTVVFTCGTVCADETSSGIVVGEFLEKNGIYSAPVYLVGADDIIVYSIGISNTVPGAVITVGESGKYDDGSYVINSDPNQEYQRVLWYATSGVTADKMPLFSIDVLMTDSAITHIPLEITLSQIGSDSTGLLSPEMYPIQTAGNLFVSDTVSASVIPGLSSDESTVPTSSFKEPTPSSTQSTVNPQNQNPDSTHNYEPPESPDYPDNVLTSTPTQTGEVSVSPEQINVNPSISVVVSSSQVQTPGFLGATSLLSICGVVLILGFRRRI